jgi:hypothetical protein
VFLATFNNEIYNVGVDTEEDFLRNCPISAAIYSIEFVERVDGVESDVKLLRAMANAVRKR